MKASAAAATKHGYQQNIDTTRPLRNIPTIGCGSKCADKRKGNRRRKTLCPITVFQQTRFVVLGLSWMDQHRCRLGGASRLKSAWALPANQGGGR
ncbi:hypothetical protein SAMN04488061_3650 [Filomicrobium insigne]|uniref:Uncharacterized protein n=1 Tax=Filomicrobium insigne TaxID=418854 RepID=A0A1H0UIN2_9HYPH|nr:hypothetical protein SAMN04488061_3650 [Filomicrobium insigne]